MTTLTAPDLVSFDELVALASNLRWTWHMDARTLFAGLFVEQTPSELEWPLRLLHRAGPALVRSRLKANPALAALAREVVEDRSDYLHEAPITWYPTTHGGSPPLRVAYFAAEFALTDSLPIFAGGLGAIAGEQLQVVERPRRAPRRRRPALPGVLPPVDRRRGRAARGVGDARPGRPPGDAPSPTRRHAAHRRAAVPRAHRRRPAVDRAGRAHLALPARHERGAELPGDRLITARLYGGDLETRIQQELVLGVGGRRALSLVGTEPNVLHLNEGHAAFAALAQVAAIAQRYDVDFSVARRIAAAEMVFTTHTPVNAGHDYFPPQLAGPYLAPYAELLGLEASRCSHSVATGPRTRPTPSALRCSACG